LAQCRKFTANGVDLTLKQGELLTILGANGRGKSTLLNCLAGLLAPKSGQILLQNCKKPLKLRNKKKQWIGGILL